jgi:hypothetical protein
LARKKAVSFLIKATTLAGFELTTHSSADVDEIPLDHAARTHFRKFQFQKFWLHIHCLCVILWRLSQKYKYSHSLWEKLRHWPKTICAIYI